jgi:hypothetical protein
MHSSPRKSQKVEEDAWEDLSVEEYEENDDDSVFGTARSVTAGSPVVCKTRNHI